MKKTSIRDLTVGTVVLLAVIIFTVAVFSIGSEQRIWVSKVSYMLRIPEANGLQSGSPVRLAGVQVGTVRSVDFSPDPSILAVEVYLSIDEAHQHRVREDTVAYVRILTLLGGEKYIELTPGNPSLPALPPGDLIRVPETFGFEQFEELSVNLSDDLTSISNNVRVILDAVHGGESVVGRMLLDPDFGKEVFEDIGTSARLMRETLEDMSEGQGLAGRMIADEQFARETTESIRSSLERMEVLLERATAEDGMVMNALDPNGKIAAAIDNVYEASASMRDFAADLKEGHGMIGRIITDETYGNEILENIRQISSDLASITDKLNRGDGTAGAFINDPQLYEDLTNVVRGVQESKMMSWFIRHYRKKGEKAAEKDRRDDVEGVDPQEKGITVGGGGL